METVIIISAFVAVVAGSPWLVEKFNDLRTTIGKEDPN